MKSGRLEEATLCRSVIQLFGLSANRLVVSCGKCSVPAGPIAHIKCIIVLLAICSSGDPMPVV
jgi:hypothetical protein